MEQSIKLYARGVGGLEHYAARAKKKAGMVQALNKGVSCASFITSELVCVCVRWWGLHTHTAQLVLPKQGASPVSVSQCNLR